MTEDFSRETGPRDNLSSNLFKKGKSLKGSTIYLHNWSDNKGGGKRDLNESKG